MCVSLSGSKLGGFEVVPMVNKPLSKRIRHGPELSRHKQVVARDLELASKLMRKLDARQDIPSESTILERAEDLLLKKGQERIVLEEKAEEDDLELMECLDSMLIYLRVVHSVDWYTGAVYKEDKMPNRLGIFHVRPIGHAIEANLESYLEDTQQRIELLIQEKHTLSEEEVMRLSGKTEEEELEKFFKESVEELSKDKWLCKLSSKKFRSFEFVKKHIVNKFPGKVRQVRLGLEFLKNFLADPDRPTLPEMLMPGSGKKSTEEKDDEELANHDEEVAKSNLPTHFPLPVPATSLPPMPREGRKGFHARGFYLEPQPLPEEVKMRLVQGDKVTDDPREAIDYGDIDTLLQMPHLKRACPW